MYWTQKTGIWNNSYRYQSCTHSYSRAYGVDDGNATTVYIV